MDIKFDCAYCNQHLSVDPSFAGQQAKCPTCGNTVTVPAQVQQIPLPQTTGDMMFCPKCGQQNHENNFKCTRCDFPLHGSSRPQYVVSNDSAMGGLIPYKNAKALWAYYLGVFSLIPCIGIPLGIAALVLGIKGLKFAKLHPNCGGKGHSLTGIILGTLCGIGYTLLIAVFVVIGMRN